MSWRQAVQRMVPYSGWMYWTRLALESAAKHTAPALIPAERIARSILVIRGRKVLLDADLAALYGVPTKALVQALKRNPDRFSDDFLFQLNRKEFSRLRSQIVTS